MRGAVKFAEEAESASCVQDAARCVERFLAGESAARKMKAMRRDQITTDRKELCCKGMLAKRLHQPNMHDDAERAVNVAQFFFEPFWYDSILNFTGSEPRWYRWLRARLRCSSLVVDSKWPEISRAVGELSKMLPLQPGKEVKISGSELNTLLGR